MKQRQTGISLLFLFPLFFLSNCSNVNDSLSSSVGVEADLNTALISTLTIVEHEHGSQLSDSVVLTLGKKVETLSIERLTESQSQLLGSYSPDDQQQITIPNEDISDGFSSDFEFRLKVLYDDEEHVTATHNFIQKVAVDHKQKALYAFRTYSPKLSTEDVTDFQVRLTWDDLSDLRDYGKQGVYDAITMGFKNGASGYFGPLVYGNPSNDGILFSFWDSDSNNVLTVPYGNDTNDGYCKRNCQDGFCGGTNNGTQCTLSSYEMEEGVEYGFRLTRVIDKTTVTTEDVFDSSISGVTYEGSVWQVSVTNFDTNDTKIVGKILFTDMYDGVNRINQFHEHLGLVPCKAFYIKSTSKIEFFGNDIDVTGLKGKANGNEDSTCEAYNVSTDSNGSVIFETGAGVTHPDAFIRDTSYTLF